MNKTLSWITVCSTAPDQDQIGKVDEENSMDATAILTGESVTDRSMRFTDTGAIDLPRVSATLRAAGVCLIREFDPDADTYLDFLRKFGRPRLNYAARSELSQDEPNPYLNRVRYKPPAERTVQSVHYVDGELPMHSARAWSTPRPSYFAMLMVNTGWRDGAADERGESVVLRWRDLFEGLARRDGDMFESHFARLTGTPVGFTANNVREEVSELSLCYPLEDMISRFDVGVRLKQGILQKLHELQERIPEFPQYLSSVEYLVSNAAAREWQTCFSMEAGDLLLIDNNRIAHGRRSFVGERTAGGIRQINPREIWSVTLD